MAYQRVEVLTGTERRRNYTSAEKVRMVEAAFRPGVVVTEAARRLGVHESLLYRWRRLMTATGTAVTGPAQLRRGDHHAGADRHRTAGAEGT